jgi:hypothetical protein
MKGITQLIKLKICYLEIINSSLTNLKVTRLDIYMIVNFRIREINRNACKLVGHSC